MTMPGGVRIDAGSAGLIVRPPDPVETVVLYGPGDRYASAGPESALDMAGQLALRTRATVLCARYRSEFPDSLEDIEAAYRYARRLGPVVVAGERLGAGLVTALMLRLRDRGAALPSCAMLVSGLLDLTLQAPSLLLNAAGDRQFDVNELRLRVAGYTGAGRAQDDPLLSPLFGNLHGLPPIQLLAAGTDPLLDDSLSFAARAARSGVTVDLRIHADADDLHGESVSAMAAFMSVSSPSGKAAEEEDRPHPEERLPRDHDGEGTGDIERLITHCGLPGDGKTSC
jgi:monoterpene epsilon-lactone hydrolase